MKKLLDGYHACLKVILTILITVMTIPVLLQIVSRYTGVIPRYIWTEEIARFCFVWMVMIGSIIAVRDGTHFDVDLLPAPKTNRQDGAGKLIVHVAMALLSIVFTYYGIEFARFGAIQTSEMSGINMLTIYVSFPVAGASWVVFLCEKIAADLRLISGRSSGAVPCHRAKSPRFCLSGCLLMRFLRSSSWKLCCSCRVCWRRSIFEAPDGKSGFP